MMKFAALFFGSWYLLMLVFPGIKGVVKGARKAVSPPSAEKVLIDESSTVKRMTSIIRSRINHSIAVSDASQVASAVVSASRRFDLDPYLILGVIYAESNAYAWAINGGSLGLMQVMPKWWDAELRKREIIKKRDDYFNIEPAVMAGSFILRLCLDRAKGDVRRALDHYTGGASARYVRKVLGIVDLGKEGK